MYYAGIDAHLNYLQIAVVDRVGKLNLDTRISTGEPEELVLALAPFRPLEVVVETCPWPRELRFIASTPQKKDAVDAALLARMLLSDLIPKVYPRGAEQRETLRLLRKRTREVLEGEATSRLAPEQQAADRRALARVRNPITDDGKGRVPQSTCSLRRPRFD